MQPQKNSKYKIAFIILIALSIVIIFLKIPSPIASKVESVTPISEINRQNSNRLCRNYLLTEGINHKTLEPLTDDVDLQQQLIASGAPWGATTEMRSPDGELIGPVTYHVLDQQQITVNYRLHYVSTINNQNSMRIRFLVILDERQINTVVDSENPYFHEINVQSGKEVSFQISLNSLAAGIHDLVVVGVPFVETDPGFTQAGHIGTFTHRITLVVGEPQVTVNQRPYTFWEPGELISNVGGIQALLLTLDQSNKVWNYPEKSLVVSTEQSYHFFVKAGFIGYSNINNPNSPDPDKSRFALLVFQDYQQIEFNEEETARYIEVSNDTAYIQFPLTLIAPSLPGLKDLVIVRIDNPGYPMCTLLDAPDGMFFGEQVRSERVLIDVKS